MCGDDAVEGVGDASSSDRVPDERAVAPCQAPAREALVLRKRLEQRDGLGILERQERKPLAAVEAGDGTRREAAEPSGRVVQEDGTTSFAHRVDIPDQWRLRRYSPPRYSAAISDVT